MAKSSRSKWKKLHRRQKAKEEATNTVKRIKQLHKKLELTIKGGISAVPPQEPEKRFHFLNPELDPRVPNTRKDLNNNYRAELNHVHYDYTKPLKLAPPKTNFYGKSDTEAPHPMTRNFEVLDADAPLGGHALTKADVERMARKQLEQATKAAAASNEEETSNKTHSENNANDENDADSDGPEEFVIGMDDEAPRRAARASLSSSSSKKKAAAVTLSKKERKPAAPKASSSNAAAAALVAKAAAAATAAEDEESSSRRGSISGTASNKITSMQVMNKRNGVMVAAGGASKMKKVGSRSGASGTRVVSSGGKAAKKNTGNKRVASK